MATIQNLIDTSTARLLDPHKTQWGDTEMLAHFQAGYAYLHQLLINHRIRWAVAASPAASITTVAGTGEYALPEGGIAAMYEGDKSDETGVWLYEAGMAASYLTPVDESEAVNFLAASNARPSLYYLSGSKIGLLPKPDKAYSLNFTYYVPVATLALSTAAPYGDLFNQALSAFASSRAQSRAGMITTGEMALYNELEAQALAIAKKRTPIPTKIKVRRN